MVLLGNELYCYRSQDDPQHILMHSLAGTFIKELPEEKLAAQFQHSNNSIWPLKIQFMPSKCRIIYFKSQTE